MADFIPNDNGSKLFACLHCTMKFSDARRLKNHKRVHNYDETKRYFCQYCSKSFPKVWYLKQHIRLHEVEEELYVCHHCKKSFAQDADLKAHVQIHNGMEPMYQCQLCDSTFSDALLLEKHMSVHDGDRSFECQLCNMKFRNANSLKIHNRVHNEAATVHDGGKSFVCQLCNLKFSNARRLKNHNRVHIEAATKIYACQYCGKRFSLIWSLKQHVRIHSAQIDSDDSPLMCLHCSKRFPDGSALSKHIRMDSCGESYACHIAGNAAQVTDNPYSLGWASTGTEQQLQLGMNADELQPPTQQRTDELLHSTQRSFNKLSKPGLSKPNTRFFGYGKRHVCQLCKRRFARSYNLRRHETVHATVKPYVCQYCGKRFTESKYLIEHSRRHNGDKLFQCEYCRKKFSRWSHIEEHKRIHTGERPYSCQHCDKRFARKSNVEQHCRIHSSDKRYHCERCSKRFIRRADLMRHNRIHIGDRPYICQLCRKNFSASSHLATHRRICVSDEPYANRDASNRMHVADGEGGSREQWPYVCRYCDMGFKQAADLVAHCVIHSCERLDPGDREKGTNGLIAHSVADTNGMARDEGFGSVRSRNLGVDMRCRLKSPRKTAVESSALKIERLEDDSDDGEFNRNDNKSEIKESFVNLHVTECVWPAVVKEENLTSDDWCLEVKPQTDWKLMVAPVVELGRVDTRKKWIV